MSAQSDGILARVAHLLKLVIGRGRITASDDSGVIQMLQVSLNAKETPDLARVGEFGLASWPPDGCDAITVFINGDRSRGVVIGTHDKPSRFKLGNKGESALFDATGDGGAPKKWIWFKKGGGIEIQAGGEAITINNAAGVTLTTTADVVLNMGGANVTINNPGAVALTGAGGRKVACDGDAVVGGVVKAAAGQKVTAT